MQKQPARRTGSEWSRVEGGKGSFDKCAANMRRVLCASQVVFLPTRKCPNAAVTQLFHFCAAELFIIIDAPLLLSAVELWWSARLQLHFTELPIDAPRPLGSTWDPCPSRVAFTAWFHLVQIIKFTPGGPVHLIISKSSCVPRIKQLHDSLSKTMPPNAKNLTRPIDKFAAASAKCSKEVSIDKSPYFTVSCG